MLLINGIKDPTIDDLEEYFTTYPERYGTSCRLDFRNSDCALTAESIAAFQYLPKKINTLVFSMYTDDGKLPSPQIVKESLLATLRAAALTRVTKLICEKSFIYGNPYRRLSLEDVREVFKLIPPNIQEIFFKLSLFDHFNTNELAELSEALPHIVKFSRPEWPDIYNPYVPDIETLNYYQADRIKKSYDALQGIKHFRDQAAVAILEYADILPPEHKKMLKQLPLQKILIDIGFDRVLKQLYDRKGNHNSSFKNPDLVGPAFNGAVVNTCNALNNAKILFLTSSESVPNKMRIFKSQCSQIINDACEGVLGQHRGFKIILDRLFKIICAVFSPNANERFHTLFRPQTNSEKLARKLEDAIQKNIEEVEEPPLAQPMLSSFSNMVSSSPPLSLT